MPLRHNAIQRTRSCFYFRVEGLGDEEHLLVQLQNWLVHKAMSGECRRKSEVQIVCVMRNICTGFSRCGMPPPCHRVASVGNTERALQVGRQAIEDVQAESTLRTLDQDSNLALFLLHDNIVHWKSCLEQDEPEQLTADLSF